MHVCMYLCKYLNNYILASYFLLYNSLTRCAYGSFSGLSGLGPKALRACTDQKLAFPAGYITQ